MDYQRHGLTRNTKRRVFEALYEMQQGKCFICGISQAELEEKWQGHAVVKAEQRKKRLEKGEIRSEEFAKWLEEHEDIAKRHEEREKKERDLSQDELAAWYYQRNAVHRTLHIDHCHTSGAIRGLLCEHCNYKIGIAENYELFHLYSVPGYLYNPLAMSRAREELGEAHLQIFNDWLDRHRESILLYMNPACWFPRKDILFHLHARK